MIRSPALSCTTSSGAAALRRQVRGGWPPPGAVGRRCGAARRGRASGRDRAEQAPPGLFRGQPPLSASGEDDAVLIPEPEDACPQGQTRRAVPVTALVIGAEQVVRDLSMAKLVPRAGEAQNPSNMARVKEVGEPEWQASANSKIDSYQVSRIRGA